MKRPEIAAAESSQRVTLLYRVLFGREPTAEEVRAGKFPDADHAYSMKADEAEKLQAAVCGLPKRK